jgi:hypothetical protein
MFWPCTDWDDAVEEDAPVTFSHMISQHNDFHAILLLVGVCCWCDTKLRDGFFCRGLGDFPAAKDSPLSVWCNDVSGTKPS